MLLGHFLGWLNEAALPAKCRVSLNFQKEERPIKCTGNEEYGLGAQPGHMKTGTLFNNGKHSPGLSGDGHD